MNQNLVLLFPASTLQLRVPQISDPTWLVHSYIFFSAVPLDKTFQNAGLPQSKPLGNQCQLKLNVCYLLYMASIISTLRVCIAISGTREGEHQGEHQGEYRCHSSAYKRRLRATQSPNTGIYPKYFLIPINADQCWYALVSILFWLSLILIWINVVLIVIDQYWSTLGSIILQIWLVLIGIG